MTDHYGSGPLLDYNFDLAVDPSGDVSVVSGISELEKDLAFNLTRVLKYGEGVESPASLAGGIVGVPLDRGTRSDIQIIVSDVLDSDDRIEDVVDVEISQGDSLDTLVIDAIVTIDTDSEEFTFVVTA